MEQRIKKESCDILYDDVYQRLKKKKKELEFSKEALYSTFNTDGKYVDIMNLKNLSDEEFMNMLFLFSISRFPKENELNIINKETDSIKKREKAISVLKKTHGFISNKVMLKNNIYSNKTETVYKKKSKILLFIRNKKNKVLDKLYILYLKMPYKYRRILKKILRK